MPFVSAGLRTSAPRGWFSPLNGWLTHSPVNASPRSSRTAAHDSGPVFFTFPEDARLNAERQAVEFGVVIG
jgi:hypothetical protein